MPHYTLRIEYGSSIETKKQVQEITNLEFTEGTQVSFNSWRNSLQKRIYNDGTCIKGKDGNFEFISPLRIHTAYLIKQDKKL